MAKKKDKQSKKIKTSRYWTKTCSNPQCNFEYPNWFTVCPKCHTPWTITTSVSSDQLEKIPSKKTIKIVVKITDETPENPVSEVRLGFTADGGNSWYQVPMEKHQDYYISEIEEMPLGSKVIYYIEAEDALGEIFTENNDGKYFSYYVESQPTVAPSVQEAQKQALPFPPVSEIPEKPFLIESQSTIKQNYSKIIDTLEKKSQQILSEKQIPIKPPEQEVGSQVKPLPQTAQIPKRVRQLPSIEIPQKGSRLQPVKVPPKGSPLQPIKAPQKPIQPRQEIFQQEPQQPKIREDEMTIFGRPQRKIDENLKVCPNCESKIKKLWTTCPICGAKNV